MGLVVKLVKGKTLQESLWKWGSLAHSTWSWIHLADPPVFTSKAANEKGRSQTHGFI